MTTPAPRTSKTDDGSGVVNVLADVVHAVVLRSNSLALFPLGEEAVRSIRASGVSKVCLLVEISGDAGSPDAAYRRELELFYGRLAPHLHGVAFVLRGKGFSGATARSVLTGLNLIARRPYATTVVSSMPEACAWIERALPPFASRPRAEVLASALGAR
jgi:hypothetical protein